MAAMHLSSRAVKSSASKKTSENQGKLAQSRFSPEAPALHKLSAGPAELFFKLQTLGLKRAFNTLFKNILKLLYKPLSFFGRAKTVKVIHRLLALYLFALRPAQKPL